MKLKKLAAGLMAGIMLLGVLSTTCLAAETDASAGENPAVLTEADAAANATEAATATPEAAAEPLPEAASADEADNALPLTPDGNLTLVDDIGSSTEAGQQFITLVTKSGNYFYLIIDRNDKGEENVHLLNMVDEADLLALMDEEQRKAFQEMQDTDTAQNTEAPAAEEPAVDPAESTEAEASETQEPQQTEKGTMNMLLIVGVILVLMICGGGYFMLQSKKKKASEQRPDPDADYTEDAEEEYVIPEDEEEITPAESEHDAKLEDTEE